jgi:hypothetical protein
MKLRYEFDNIEYHLCRCPLRRKDWKSYCLEIGENCDGDLKNRPDFCPLVEVNDEKEI